MSSATGANSGAAKTSQPVHNPSDQGSDDIDINNASTDNKPTRKRSHDDLDDKEDPETQAASEDLRKSTISDRLPADNQNEAVDPASQAVQDKDVHESKRVKTPERAAKDAADEDMKERVLSPKKKRGREVDADDDVKELEAESKLGDGEAASGAANINGSRSTRLGPEKKRYRDSSTEPPRSEDRLQKPEVSEPVKTSVKGLAPEDAVDSKKPSDATTVQQTPASAFASSGFSSHVGTTSAFGALGATKSTSVFGGGSAAPMSGFGALGSSAGVKPLSSFASPSVSAGVGKDKEAEKTPISGFGAAAKSGFGGLGSGLGGGFGSGFGSGFAGGSGPKLTSFASGSTPKIIGASDKPAKAFGAPESDEEDEGSDDEGSDGEDASEKDDDDDSKGTDEKKKPKISKVPITINDGEEDEDTLIQVRAKLFALVKDVGWKERGVGAIKLNTAKAGFETDEITGEKVAVGDAKQRSARLIMRQESTHRVILNSPLLKAIKFSDDKAANGTYKISFTAVEDNKPVNLLLKMSETNALGFLEKVRDLQTKL